ncbi:MULTISPECIES: hypothetical protein [Sphingobacterium]|uniref:hypothetical protein n=1 Tax=Sphingobacterium TaxID=28453 RepID=UPI0013D996B0|nr:MULTISPECIES: hypothetical protein [unclassified Sphingobacterium]
MEKNVIPEHENGIPEVVKNEPDDKPAGQGIIWAIVIAVVVLAIIYFVFFKKDPRV